MRLSIALADCLAAGEPAVLVRIVVARGSTPRDAGTMMMVTAAGSKGTIGGGALEQEAIAEARRMLDRGLSQSAMDIPLGPAIGQCCGGRVELAFRRADAQVVDELVAADKAAGAGAIPIVLFGAGHTGRAIAAALAPLPFRVLVVDTRPALLAQLPAGTEAQAMALPEQAVAAAAPGTGFLVVTHDHALDFILAAACLARKDAGYVGMIGSATKLARFHNHLRAGGLAGEAGRLRLPIGGSAVRDKRPEVIAALVAAELLAHFLGRTVENPVHRLCTCP